MARRYWIKGNTAQPDGASFDSWTARTRMVGNAEAAYECSGFDQTIILSSVVTATTIHEPVLGPMPIPMRLDRNGLWRVPWVSPLVAGGDNGATFRVVLTDKYHRPYTASLLDGMNSTFEPYVDFVVLNGTTPAWRSAVAIDLPEWFSPMNHDEPGGADERGRTSLAWWSVWVLDLPHAAYPMIAGIRWFEAVAEEPS